MILRRSFTKEPQEKSGRTSPPKKSEKLSNGVTFPCAQADQSCISAGKPLQGDTLNSTGAHQKHRETA